MFDVLVDEGGLEDDQQTGDHNDQAHAEEELAELLPRQLAQDQARQEEARGLWAIAPPPNSFQHPLKTIHFLTQVGG